MKKIISLILVFALLFAFSACGNNDAGTSDETQNKEWQVKYEETLQKYIDDGVLFGGVYVEDTDGDGIPTVALATNPFWFKIPAMILNYVDGNVVIQGEFEEVASGDAVTTEVYFINGTNDFVYRSVANTTGTFGYGINEYQRFYTFSPSGAYDQREVKYSLPYDLEEEYMSVIQSGSYDTEKYRDYIIDEMNSDLEETYGSSVTLINFIDVVEVFSVQSEEEINANQQRAVDYLNEKLGINLTFDQ